MDTPPAEFIDLTKLPDFTTWWAGFANEEYAKTFVFSDRITAQPTDYKNIKTGIIYFIIVVLFIAIIIVALK